MAIGKAKTQLRFENPGELLGDRLKGIYSLLASHGQAMFPDDYFADCYTESRKGRPTIPARLLATVMLLQSHEGLSDQEACDRLEFDLRWQAATGLHTGCESFHPTTLVGMRNRLRASERPRRLFEDTKIAARQSGTLGNRVRVLDSTPIHDAVATQDTVTQLRSAIRKLLRTLDQNNAGLAAKVRAALRRDDDYATPGKPPCDWDDKQARELLIDALVGDANAALGVLEDKTLVGSVLDAADLLAIVAGQDVEEGEDGVFRIRRGVAKDRIISTVDTEARHGHKSRNRRFDGYKGHISIDPDSELIDEVVVTPANTPDRDAVDELVGHSDTEQVMGDSAYAGGDTRESLENQGKEVVAKVPPARNREGRFSKDDFVVDPENNTVTCPQGNTVTIKRKSNGGGKASFGGVCKTCPLRSQCSKSDKGRTIAIHKHETRLQKAKAGQATEEWKENYKSTRPKVERKIAHLIRKPWGGRMARVRGVARITTDVLTRAAAVNWSRLAALGLERTTQGWTVVSD